VILLGVGIATGWASRIRFTALQDFSLLQKFRQTLGSSRHPLQWVLGTVSLGVKRQGREADHSSPSSDDVKKSEVILLLLHLLSTEISLPFLLKLLSYISN
jgi:hypothetical protein